MSHDVVSVGPEAPLRDVAELLVAHRVSGLPVCDETGRVVGVVSEADVIWVELGRQLASGVIGWILAKVDHEHRRITARTAGEAMSSPALTIASTATDLEAAQIMIEHHVNGLPVVDDGRLVGIVARADLVRAFLRPDETNGPELGGEPDTTAAAD